MRGHKKNCSVPISFEFPSKKHAQDSFKASYLDQNKFVCMVFV